MSFLIPLTRNPELETRNPNNGATAIARKSNYFGEIRLHTFDSFILT